MANKGLTSARAAHGPAKPSTWAIRGVALGPREADPAIRGATWAAWATGPHGERLQAHGDSPEDALLALTVQLRGLSG